MQVLTAFVYNVRLPSLYPFCVFSFSVYEADLAATTTLYFAELENRYIGHVFTT